MEKANNEQKTRTITLTEAEIDCFNAYIEDAQMRIAWKNQDWCDLYRKIVGDDKVSRHAKVWMATWMTTH